MHDRSTKGFLSSLTRLVDAVANDVQKLGHGAADLVRETAASSHKTGRIGSTMIGGGAAVLIGAILLCMMFVHLLAWAAPGMPMWVSYAVIGLPVLGAGIGLIAWARRSQKMTLEPLQQQSAKVVRDVKETGERVGQQIDAARESLHETVESIRNTFDIREQIDRRPWTMVVGALSLGFIGASVIRDHPGAKTGVHSEDSRILDRLAQKFEPEIAKLKGLALGTLFGIVRDLAAGSIPGNMEKDVEDVIDRFTVKIGGTPIHGHVLHESSNGRKDQAVSPGSH